MIDNLDLVVRIRLHSCSWRLVAAFTWVDLGEDAFVFDVSSIAELSGIYRLVEDTGTQDSLGMAFAGDNVLGNMRV